MGWQADSTDVFTSMHHRLTGELLHLMDGLYSNIEDGLFELAFQAPDDDQKRRCFDLMRDMRFQRSRVVQTFARRTQAALDAWIAPATAPPADPLGHPRAMRLAQKCTSHFRGVLQSLTERSAYGLGREVDPAELPFSPYRIACHFIESMKALRFDDKSIEVVEDLFQRFVLERLGSIYGECNLHLQRAGFVTVVEAAELAKLEARAAEGAKIRA
jgi:hypothetical protein